MLARLVQSSGVCRESRRARAKMQKCTEKSKASLEKNENVYLGAKVACVVGIERRRSFALHFRQSRLCTEWELAGVDGLGIKEPATRRSKRDKKKHNG